MKKILTCLLIVSVLSAPAPAADGGTQANPTGVINGVVPQHAAVPAKDDLLCGVLIFDGVNGIPGLRRNDGSVETWVLANCKFFDVTTVAGMSWLTIDNHDLNWIGLADYAIWDADTVENGCADDGNTLFDQRDLPNTREPLLDDNGNQVILFERNAWIYTLYFRPLTLSPGEYYLAPRPVLGAGSSFILTRPCNGDKPIWFRSDFFGYPCTAPGSYVFGVDYCVAIVPLGELPPPEPTCIYEVTKVKAKPGVCGESCAKCPYILGDLLCTVECDPDAPDCEGRLRGFNACADGGACKVKANNVGCDAPPDGCTRCE